MLIGHKALVKDLKSLADRRALPHGYILYGQPRTGKATFALSLANYLEAGEFQPEHTGVLGDLLLIRPEAGTIGIDPVRAIREFLSRRPNRSPYRMVVVDQADALTDEAQNALLKVAEEPPESAFLVLVLEDPERLRPTLQSRFQKLYFAPVGEKEIAAWLAKEKEISAEKAQKAAKEAQGSPGLALALLMDEELKARLAAARKYLGTAARDRNAYVKEILEDENFRLYEFLEAVLLVFGERSGKNPAFWHAACELRRQASYFNLNPRLQLLALGEKLAQ